MSGTQVSGVLFAQDHRKLAEFYGKTFAATCTVSDAHHSALSFRGFELVIHQAPTGMRAAPTTALPVRESAALRLDFVVDDIGAARSVAISLGGHVEAAPPPWADPTERLYLGHDPEGNVFLLKGPSNEESRRER